MVDFYPRPTDRESMVMFGDGNEAVFLTAQPSSEKGYTFFKLRPLPQMRWKLQILDNQYNPNDKWVYRKYKSDLCFPLSTDPDYGQWIILCDYYGNEDTPLFDYFVKCKQVIQRNRDLSKENFNLRAALNKKLLQEMEKAKHPDADMMKALNNAKWINDSAKLDYPMQQPAQFPGEESG